MADLSPKQIAVELDKHIVGQDAAKRAVAIALRNRWRRMKLPEALRNEVTPKNILMIGPTGVGKTEIARRLARLAGSPFIKVEATKFTEVGYVGRDVESIIRDLVDVAYKMLREQQIDNLGTQAADAAEDKVLDILLPGPSSQEKVEPLSVTEADTSTRQIFRKKLREGDLDDKEIEIKVSDMHASVEIMAPPGMEDMTNQLSSMFSNLGSQRKKTRRVTVKSALKLLQDEEAAKLINEEDLKSQAVTSTEQTAIVFIDEIDKVATKNETTTGGVSREGVQRDLLPKYGPIKTDHILFIASGAFHLSKPSDLIPELQGRLPIRVELDALSVDDFNRILTEPDASLSKQYQALLATENLSLEFTEDGIQKISEIAWDVNERTENIGARRLHTVLEKLLEDISFRADELVASGKDTFIVDAAFVEFTLSELSQNEDLSRFIL